MVIQSACSTNHPTQKIREVTKMGVDCCHGLDGLCTLPNSTDPPATRKHRDDIYKHDNWRGDKHDKISGT